MSRLFRSLSFDVADAPADLSPDIRHSPGGAPGLHDALTDLAWQDEIRCTDQHRVYFRDGWLQLPTAPDSPFLFESFGGHHDLGGPLGAALVFALARRGALLLHASCFRLDGQGLLVLGPSGAGKSTLTLAALRLGGQAVSDDIVALATESTPPVAAAIRPDMVLREPALTLAPPGLAARMHRGGTPNEPRWILPRADNPERFCDGQTIDRILLLQPRRDDAVTVVRPCAASDAVGQMLSHDPFVHNARVNPAAELAKIGRLLANSRIFTCRAGTDVLNDPAGAFRRILEPQPVPD